MASLFSLQEDDDEDFMVDVDADGRVAGFPGGADGKVHPPSYAFRSFPGALGHLSPSELDDLRAAARLTDMCFDNATHFVPAGAAPRNSLEALALSVFELHPAGGVTFDPARSGAEWWVQIRPQGETAKKEEKEKAKEKESTAGSSKKKKRGDHVDIDAVEEDEEVDHPIKWHWDKDEILRTQIGLHVFPNISTVTYLSETGAPTCVVPCRMSNEGTLIEDEDELQEEDEQQQDEEADQKPRCRRRRRRRHIFVSHPRVGKHISFDGRFLHAAPHLKMPPPPPPPPQQQQQQDAVEEEKKKDKGSGGKGEGDLEGEGDANGADLAPPMEDRMTFLVNVWLNYVPKGTTPMKMRSGTGKDEAGAASLPRPLALTTGFQLASDVKEVAPRVVDQASLAGSADGTTGGKGGNSSGNSSGGSTGGAARYCSMRHSFGPRGSEYTLGLTLAEEACRAPERGERGTADDGSVLVEVCGPGAGEAASGSGSNCSSSRPGGREDLRRAGYSLAENAQRQEQPPAGGDAGGGEPGSSESSIINHSSSKRQKS